MISIQPSNILQVKCMHKISVIVPVYNVENHLEKCVRSIQAQTYDNLEIILVDDGSPDQCGLMCDAFAAEDNRIRVIHKENGGLSSARNAGIDASTGEYLAFVDSDDWIDPPMYAMLYKLCLDHQAQLAEYVDHYLHSRIQKMQKFSDF